MNRLINNKRSAGKPNRALPKPFPPGPTAYGNMEVLKLVELRDPLLESTYHVRFSCCGVEKLLTHRKILDRIRKRFKACNNCKYAKAQEEKEKAQAAADERASTAQWPRPNL